MPSKRKVRATSFDKNSAATGDVSHSTSKTTMDLDIPTKSTFEAKDRYFRNLYNKAPDFKQLARLDPDFAAVYVSLLRWVDYAEPSSTKGRDLDFNDPASVMQLTKTLLKLDFMLQIELPNDRLCPPVANRHNYILWLTQLLETSTYSSTPQPLTGLDIGTGASCIYPLLGCTQRPWSFIATDIDQQSLTFAKKNIELNDLRSRILLLHREPSESLIPETDTKIDFVMTNPPFYESEAAMTRSADEKKRPPLTACTGSPGEMVTEGGELGFVQRILDESLVLRDKIQWYTSMFGFLSSVTTLVQKLREHKIDNFAVTEFVQGNKTRRWAVGWSFGPMRPVQSAARGTKAALSKNILPSTSEYSVPALPLPNLIGDFAEKLSSTIGRLDLVSWEWDKQKMEGVGRAVDKVWARAWRRRKKREQETPDEAPKDGADSKEVVFGFKVWIRIGEEMNIGCRWTEGHDWAVFESFQGYLKSTVLSIHESSKIQSVT